MHTLKIMLLQSCTRGESLLCKVFGGRSDFYLSIGAGFIEGILAGKLEKLWWIGNVFEEDHSLSDDVISSSASIVVLDSTIGVEDLDRWVALIFAGKFHVKLL